MLLVHLYASVSIETPFQKVHWDSVPAEMEPPCFHALREHPPFSESYSPRPMPLGPQNARGAIIVNPGFGSCA